MEHHNADPVALAAIVGLGVGAQWLAWKLKVPSILLLLASGVVAGPVLGIVQPEQLLGDLLFPFVSMSVAIILFEGSLSLRLTELKQIGAPLFALLTVGVAVTWVLTTVSAYLILNMELFPSVLLGAILVVTGPTVIGPMLRQIRPTGRVGPIARWEGIVIDPIGAVMAVLVYEGYESVVSSGLEQGARGVFIALGMTLLVGIGIGTLSAYGLAILFRKHWIPDYLESPVTLMFVVAAFTASNIFQPEAGLVTVTVMGFVLANTGVSLKHVIEFKENLSLLLISSLFVLLTSRLDPAAFATIGWRGPIFVSVMILLIRPAAVFLSMARSRLNWKEQVFLAWLAPRGIVAAAVASVFALQLGDAGRGLVPATFSLIIGSVVVYGLTTGWLARSLGLATTDPQGVVILGANRFARKLGLAFQEAGFSVLLIDTNHANVAAARMEKLRIVNVNILSEYATEHLDLGGIGRYLGMTGNDEINAMGGLHFAELFGRSNAFQLTPYRQAEGKKDVAVAHLRLRTLFDSRLTYYDFEDRLDAGAVLKATRLTDEFTYEKFLEQYNDAAVLLAVVQQKKLTICTTDAKVQPKSGQTVITLVKPLEKTSEHNS